MTPVTALIEDLESARTDLEDLLVEVVGTVFGDEAHPTAPASFAAAGAGADEVAVSRLEIHDPGDASYTVIEVRLDVAAARALACRMFHVDEPTGDDLLDAVGELGNIAAGNVKSLLRQTSQLSLPSARLTGDEPEPDHAVEVAAIVSGHRVQLGVFPADISGGAIWPGASTPF